MNGSFEPLAATDGWLPFLLPACNARSHCLNNHMESDNDWQSVARPGEGQATCFTLQVSMRLPDEQTVDLQEQGFLLCFQGKIRAWRNHCPHAGSPLDWIPGQFFSEDGEDLICHTHGARFNPLSGACLSGPCPRGLFPLTFIEQGDVVLLPVAVEIMRGL